MLHKAIQVHSRVIVDFVPIIISILQLGIKLLITKICFLFIILKKQWRNSQLCKLNVDFWHFIHPLLDAPICNVYIIILNSLASRFRILSVLDLFLVHVPINFLALCNMSSTPKYPNISYLNKLYYFLGFHRLESHIDLVKQFDNATSSLY